MPANRNFRNIRLCCSKIQNDIIRLASIGSLRTNVIFRKPVIVIIILIIRSIIIEVCIWLILSLACVSHYLCLASRRFTKGCVYLSFYLIQWLRGVNVHTPAADPLVRPPVLGRSVLAVLRFQHFNAYVTRHMCGIKNNLRTVVRNRAMIQIRLPCLCGFIRVVIYF